MVRGSLSNVWPPSPILLTHPHRNQQHRGEGRGHIYTSHLYTTLGNGTPKLLSWLSGSSLEAPACFARLEAAEKGGQNANMLWLPAGPYKGQGLDSFQLLSGAAAEVQEDTPGGRTARAQGLCRDVGLYVRPSLAPGQLGDWEAGEAVGLQAHKKKWLVLLPDESTPGWVGREERCC